MTLEKIRAITLMLIRASAMAQERGSAQAGLAYANQVCAQCHIVAPEGGSTPSPGVMSFKEIANRPGMSAMAIGVWMQSEHEAMPHIVPEAEQSNDVIAYIVSLKD